MNVGDLIERLSSLHPSRPVRVIDETTSGPLSVASGAYVVDVAYENECVFVVTRDRDAHEQKYMVAAW